MARYLLVTLVAVAMTAANITGAHAYKGVVVTNDGKPVAGARVIVFQWSGNVPIQDFTTDEAGRFSYEQPSKEGGWYILAVAEQRCYGLATVSEGEPGESRLVMWPGKTARGKVVDDTGAPIAGARIKVDRMNVFAEDGSDICRVRLPGFGDWAGTATTDASGEFALEHLFDWSKAGKCKLALVVSREGWTGTAVELSKKDLGGDIKLQLNRLSRLTGTVYMPGKNAPAPEGAELLAECIAPNGGVSGTKTLKLDKSGRFELDVSSDNKTMLSLSPPDPKTAKESATGGFSLEPLGAIQVKPGETKNLDLVLVKAALVRGKILWYTGNPVRGGRVELTRDDAPAGTAPQRVSFDGNGEFVTNVAPGRMTFALSGVKHGDRVSTLYSDCEIPSAHVDVAEGAEATVSLKVSRDVARDYDSESREIPADFRIKAGSYDLTWDPDFGCDSRWDRLEGGEAKSLIRKIPKLVSKKPFYIAQRLDGPGNNGYILAVFDESKGTGKGHDTAYIDSNRNADLADEQPIRWQLRKYTTYTPWQTVNMTQGAGAAKATNPGKVRWVFHSGGSAPSLQRSGAWTGKVDTSGGPVEFALTDYNANGLFSDQYTVINNPWPGYQANVGDYAYVNTNDCPYLVSETYNKHSLALCPASMCGASYYVVTATPAGNRVTIRPYTGALGQLSVTVSDISGFGGKADRLWLRGSAGSYIVRLDGPITLPAGTYSASCSLTLKDSSERTLNLSGSFANPVEVKPNETTEIALGGKPTIHPLPNDASPSMRPGQEIGIDFELRIGDDLSNARVSSQAVADLSVQFDPSSKFVKAKPIDGG